MLTENGKKSAFFYSWEELRDVARPGSLDFAYFCSGSIGYQEANHAVTTAAIEHLQKESTDFAFLYLEYPDYAGHEYGWMSEEYMEEVQDSWENINRILATLTEDYAVIITADHGGHDRTHGSEMPEDMLIPFVMTGNGVDINKKFEDVNLKDIAPTIVKLMGIAPNREREGKSVL